MVAAGILSARGLIPPETITAALQLPFKISFPMVPAEGLYLKYAGFGRNADKVSSVFIPFNVCGSRMRTSCLIFYTRIVQ
jgi:tRNA U38,U39,U40 pseudouridine synthase TruA